MSAADAQTPHSIVTESVPCVTVASVRDSTGATEDSPMTPLTISSGATVPRVHRNR